jgi:hypothetical protein
LARRFRDHQYRMLRFTTDLAVGFTSNQAGYNDVRQVKIEQPARARNPASTAPTQRSYRHAGNSHDGQSLGTQAE